MRIALTSLAAGVLALVVGSMSAAPDAEARRLGGVRGVGHIHPGRVVRPVVRPGRVVARRAYRAGYRAGRWVNGVWVVNGVAASVAVGASSCDYYYRKWRETGSSYWRDQYYAHCR